MRKCKGVAKWVLKQPNMCSQRVYECVLRLYMCLQNGLEFVYYRFQTTSDKETCQHYKNHAV